MYAALIDALTTLELDFVEEPTEYGADFLPRMAPDDGVRLSYHSVGNAKNVWRIKETPIPFYYGIDRLGYSGWSELCVRQDVHQARIRDRSVKDAKVFCRELANWLIDNNLSKYRQTCESASLPQQFVFFPLQVANDVVAQHNRLDPVKVLRNAAKYAERFDTPLLVKRHPYCKSIRIGAWLTWMTKSKTRVHVTNDSVTKLLPASTAVLVGNSGVGLEALVYGRPVYSFAASEYDLASYQIHSLEDLEQIFRQSTHRPREGACRFVHYYLKECCFDARNKEDVQRKLGRVIRDTESGVWLPSRERKDHFRDD